MFDYKTVEEKATEWGLTPRHVQHLCRKGKIEGAVKRAGAWFISDEAPNPVKNTKADDKPFKFVGTKKKIFDNSIKLFTQKGYENVSINDIAATIGIRQSAVYNHFKSKQEILETIYKFYYHNYLIDRIDPEVMDSLLQKASLMDIIIKGFLWEFDENILGQMADISKIIIQRASTDESAAEIFQKLMLEEGVRFVDDGLKRAVEINRLAPFNTRAVAVLINSVRLCMLLWWLANPPYDTYMRNVKDEQAAYEYVITLLTDMDPPANQ